LEALAEEGSTVSGVDQRTLWPHHAGDVAVGSTPEEDGAVGSLARRGGNKKGETLEQADRQKCGGAAKSGVRGASETNDE
jgi:hypothetical protein